MAALNPLIRVVEFPDIGHADNCAQRPDDVVRIVGAFFEEALAGAEDGARAAGGPR